MKKNRTLIVAVLLVAALALGVGYAAITGNLFIHGKVTTAAQTFNVVFTDYETKSATRDGVETGVLAGSTDAISTEGVQTVKFFVTGMSYVDDTVVGRFEVTNNNEVAMFFNADPIVTNEGGMFQVTVAWDTDYDTANGIAPNGGAAHLLVTVKMLRGATDAIDIDFTVQLPATSDAPIAP